MNPLPAAEVRRLGDRRRRTRRGVAGAIGALAVAAIAIPLALLPHDAKSDAPPVTTTTTASPTPTPTPGAVIDFPGNGVTVTDPADVDKLTGTSSAFRAFIAEQVRVANLDGAGCPDAAHGVTVQRYSPDGYALGGVNSCGGYAALWGIREGTWQEAAGTQDQWDCDELRFFDIPRSFAGPCGNESGGFGPTTVNDISLGMTAEQVTTAGGVVGGKPTDQCRGVKLPYMTNQPGDGAGELQPDIGVIVVFARPGMLTPEGIGLGSTPEAVREAYPNGHDAMGYWEVPTGTGKRYQFLIGGPDHMVTEMNISVTHQRCFG